MDSICKLQKFVPCRKVGLPQAYSGFQYARIGEMFFVLQGKNSQYALCLARIFNAAAKACAKGF